MARYILILHVKHGKIHFDSSCKKCNGIKVKNRRLLNDPEYAKKELEKEKVQLLLIACNSKECTQCNKIKFLDEFYYHRGWKRYEAACKDCRNKKRVNDYIPVLKENYVYSLGEDLLEKFLIKYSIKYKREMSLDRNHHSYDAHLPDYNLVIEIHGNQHYKYSEFFHKTEKGFEVQQKTDIYKQNMLKQYNINYLEIPYKDIYKIEEILVNSLYLHFQHKIQNQQKLLL